MAAKRPSFQFVDALDAFFVFFIFILIILSVTGVLKTRDIGTAQGPISGYATDANETGENDSRLDNSQIALLKIVGGIFGVVFVMYVTAHYALHMRK